MSDVKINIIDRNSNNVTIEVPTDMGLNLMEAIHSYGVAEEGSIGVCGGIGMCASCQCYVLNGGENLPEKNETEVAMLLTANFVKENSRLACQIPVTESLAEVLFELAPEE